VNQERDKESSRIPIFILVHPSSKVTSGLFAYKERNSLKRSQRSIQFNTIQYNCTLQYTTSTPPQKLQNPTQNPNYTPYAIWNTITQLQTTNRMQFVTKPLKIQE